MHSTGGHSRRANITSEVRVEEQQVGVQVFLSMEWWARVKDDAELIIKSAAFQESHQYIVCESALTDLKAACIAAVQCGILPSASAEAERMYSLLKMFSHLRKRSLNDQIKAGVIKRYNATQVRIQHRILAARMAAKKVKQKRLGLIKRHRAQERMLA